MGVGVVAVVGGTILVVESTGWLRSGLNVTTCFCRYLLVL